MTLTLRLICALCCRVCRELIDESEAERQMRVLFGAEKYAWCCCCGQLVVDEAVRKNRAYQQRWRRFWKKRQAAELARSEQLDAQLAYADEHYGCSHPAPEGLF